MLDSRTRITVDEYETIFSETLPEHGECAEYTSDVPFRLQRSKMIFVTTKYNKIIKEPFTSRERFFYLRTKGAVYRSA